MSTHIIVALVIGFASYIGASLAGGTTASASNRAAVAPAVSHGYATGRYERRPYRRTRAAGAAPRASDTPELLRPSMTAVATPETRVVHRVRFKEVAPGVIRAETWNEEVAVARPAVAQGASPVSGHVDLNTASPEELDRLPGVGPETAKRIIASRPFRSIQDLRRVPGIGPVRYARLAPFVAAGR